MKNNTNNFASANEICNEFISQSNLDFLPTTKYFRVLKVIIYDQDWKWSKLHNVFMDGSNGISNFINSIINKAVEKAGVSGDKVTIDTVSEQHGNVGVAKHLIKASGKVIYMVKVEDTIMDLENENLF